MSDDLSYFYEINLDKGTLVCFHNSLPNHLRGKFKDSLGGVDILDRDSTNFLQGYRGPYTNGGSGDSEYLGPVNGLQEVRHWWGVSKSRILQDTNWHSLYFDSKTGECLSHNKNKAAEKLNKKGHQLFQQGKYAKAAEYHNNAYLACSSGYKNEQEFKNDRDRAEAEKDAVNLNSQGESLFSEGKYAKAVRKYQEAYDKSQIYKEYKKYKANRRKAEAELDAMDLNYEGDNLFNQRRYSEALRKYEEAYDISQISEEYNKYDENRRKAKAELDAMHLNSEGYNLFNQRKYSEALRKYQEACDKSQISMEYNKYHANTRKAEAELYAMHLNSEGDNLFNQRKYSEALRKYQEACDKSQISMEYNKYHANRRKAEAELDAMHLNSEGDNLFNQMKYSEALRKYQHAYDKSQISNEYDKYSSNMEKAQAEINAINLNFEGDNLFNQRKYSEALRKYQEAYDKSQIRNEYDKYSSNIEKAQAEINAINSNFEGDNLFNQRKYSEAINKYQEAFDLSQIKEECNKYCANRKKAQAELDAMYLNSEGSSLFNQRKYSKALRKYQEAYDKSQISNEYDKYSSNIEKAQAEINAINLNFEGDNLFNQRKYSEALRKYQEAYDKSQIRNEYDKYSSNIEKAQAEINAINSNFEGDNLFNQSRYAEALSNYQKAFDLSQIKEECNKYCANRKRAQAEIDAMHLNSEGNNLFSQSKYAEAVIKYQAAYDKSDVEKEKIKYALSKNNAQSLKNKLSILDTLWKEAWEAENDDRSGEAKDLFQRVLNETKDSLKIFPDNLRFKQYEILVSLKIEGNELFNEGLEAQQDGSKLFEEAQKLQLQQKFESALIKYKEARNKFSEAQENFKTGREKDQRFVSCVDFVQDQLDNVLELIQTIEQRTLSLRLFNLDIGIGKSNRSEADSCLCNVTEDHNYSKQI